MESEGEQVKHKILAYVCTALLLGLAGYGIGYMHGYVAGFDDACRVITGLLGPVNNY